MFKDAEEFGRGEETYLILVCEGLECPTSIWEARQHLIAEVIWDQVNFQITVEAQKTGCVRWVCLTDGLQFKARPTKFPLIVRKGDPVQINIARNEL